MISYSHLKSGEPKMIDIPTQDIISWIDVSEDMKFMAMSTNIGMLLWDLQKNVEFKRIKTDYVNRQFCFFSDDSEWLLFTYKYSEFCLNTCKQIFIRVQHFGGLGEICINRFNVISKLIDRKYQILNLQTLQYAISQQTIQNNPQKIDLMKDDKNHFCNYFLDQRMPGQQLCFEIWNIQRFRIWQYFKITNSNWMHTSFKLNKTMIAIFHLQFGNQSKITQHNIFNNKLIAKTPIDGHVFQMNYSANNNQLYLLLTKAIGQINLATRSVQTQKLELDYLKIYNSTNENFIQIQELY